VIETGAELGSLADIAARMDATADILEKWGVKFDAVIGMRMAAGNLRARHDHADPCDECPCVQAERERWEGDGHGDDCMRAP
jgi:hypothetical protein